MKLNTIAFSLFLISIIGCRTTSQVNQTQAAKPAETTTKSDSTSSNLLAEEQCDCSLDPLQEALPTDSMALDRGGAAGRCLKWMWDKACKAVQKDPCPALKGAKLVACKGMEDLAGNVVSLQKCNKANPPTSALACQRAAEFGACAAARKAYDMKCFNGGDAGHKQQVIDMLKAAASCTNECNLKKIKEGGGFIPKNPKPTLDTPLSE